MPQTPSDQHSSSLTFRTSTTADLAAIARMTHHAFASPVESCRTWIEPLLADHRVLAGRDAGGAEVVMAGALTIPMGQYFGGRSVPMLGIAGVAVPPENRGGGMAEQMMAGILREACGSGVALSTLYASTQSLYRKVGYEQAGRRARFRIAVDKLQLRVPEPLWRDDGRPVSVAWRELTEEDQPAVVRCYDAFAQGQNGMLRRGAYMWGRVRLLRGTAFTGFGLFAADGSVGSAVLAYVFLNQEKLPSGKVNVHLSDLAFSSPDAARAVVHFLARFGTMAEAVELSGGASHPLFILLAQQPGKEVLGEHWMMRIVNVPAALEARGYSPRAAERLLLRITDRTVEHNAGLWELQVEGGRGKCVRVGGVGADAPAGGGTGLTLDISALAPLYSGLATARGLASMGFIQGGESALDVAELIFGAAHVPWCADGF